jgi:hypothetical protein
MQERTRSKKCSFHIDVLDHQSQERAILGRVIDALHHRTQSKANMILSKPSSRVKDNARLMASASASSGDMTTTLLWWEQLQRDWWGQRHCFFRNTSLH